MNTATSDRLPLSVVNLRIPEPTDIDALYLWYNDPRQWRQSLSQPMVSRHHISEFVQNGTHSLLTEGQLCMVIEVDGEAIGTVDICDYNAVAATAFVSIYIATEHRQHGYGRQALESAVAVARDAFGIRSLAALIVTDNKASQRIFAACGFVESGILRSWLAPGVDVAFWQYLS